MKCEEAFNEEREREGREERGRIFNVNLLREEKEGVISRRS
jgi:hypothetical protein